jgi:hypothetical protein
MEMREMVGWLARSVLHSGKEPQTTLSKGSSRKESPELDAFFSGLPVALLYSTLRDPSPNRPKRSLYLLLPKEGSKLSVTLTLPPPPALMV